MWAAAIVTFFKGSVALRDIFEKAVVLFYAEQDRRDQNQTDDVQKEREALTAALSQPGMTDANRRILLKRLMALHRL
ncbi:MAG: hypothetical protein H0X02_11365 [Nitrosomonas sp.]|nr:hypothetical protein [Nitrosomonas sp.]